MVLGNAWITVGLQQRGHGIFRDLSPQLFQDYPPAPLGGAHVWVALLW